VSERAWQRLNPLPRAHRKVVVLKGEKWLVFSAWPYVNAVPHLGNLIGSILSADIAARFLRMKGAEVVFASGSDQHGTPIEVEAIKRGVDPKKMADEMHEVVRELFDKWNISFDIYTKTDNPVHIEFVREFYRKVYENGYVFSDVVQVLYCPNDKIYLPDRFVEGTCPYCGYPRARGDQCDNCGRLLDPLQLIEPRCVFCGSKPEVRETVHWFFDLPKLSEKIREYVEKNPNLPENARNMSLQMVKEGLRPRSLTRDNKWGIPAPFPGAEGKTIYVWMEAVLGYISAVKEYFERRGEPEKWKEFWLDPSTKSVYFIGKDNIPFHVIIFPALLMASGEGYVLPWTVASTEYLLFEGEKFSKSRGIGIWIDEALELLPVDYWRFALVWMRPEVRDSSFTWKGLQEAVNSQLNDAIGNLAHRTLTLVKRRFDYVIPQPGGLRKRDESVLSEAWSKVDEAEKSMMEFRFKKALSSMLEIAYEGNAYINEMRPWEEPLADAAKTLFTACSLVKTLAVTLAPIIPESAQKMWEMLGYSGSVEEAGWDEAKRPVTPGLRIREPVPLFRKISDEELKALQAKLAEIRARKAQQASG